MSVQENSTSGANSQTRFKSTSVLKACADDIKLAGLGLSNLISKCAALTLTRLPESNST